MKRHSNPLLLSLIIGLTWLSLGWAEGIGESKRPSQQAVAVLTANDNGKEIRVRQGDLFRIELETPGATGYLWQVEDLDTTRLVLINQSTRVLLSDGRLGGPVLSVFTFRGISEGSVTLTIDFYRPWEGRSKSEKTFSVKINIV
jgi:predicted secreted protein